MEGETVKKFNYPKGGLLLGGKSAYSFPAREGEKSLWSRGGQGYRQRGRTLRLVGRHSKRRKPLTFSRRGEKKTRKCGSFSNHPEPRERSWEGHIFWGEETETPGRGKPNNSCVVQKNFPGGKGEGTKEVEIL